MKDLGQVNSPEEVTKTITQQMKRTTKLQNEQSFGIWGWATENLAVKASSHMPIFSRRTKNLNFCASL